MDTPIIAPASAHSECATSHHGPHAKQTFHSLHHPVSDVWQLDSSE